MHLLATLLGKRALVLKEFKISLDGPLYVHIIARRAGIIAWILSLLGVDSTTQFDVYREKIDYQESSLSGKLKTSIPMKSISIVNTGYLKPILCWVFSMIAFFVSVFCFVATLANNDGRAFAVIGAIAFIIAIGFIVRYYLNKNVVLSVISHSGFSAGICFKRSIIEGVKVDEEQAQTVMEAIDYLIQHQSA